MVLRCGLTLMGARLYSASTGRYTSIDPVHGGNASAYNYPDDPVNTSDLTGLAPQGGKGGNRGRGGKKVEGQPDTLSAAEEEALAHPGSADPKVLAGAKRKDTKNQTLSGARMRRNESRMALLIGQNST